MNNQSKLHEALSFLKAVDTTQQQFTSRILEDDGLSYGNGSSVMQN